MKMKLNAGSLSAAQQELEEFVSTLAKKLPSASFELGEWSDDGLTNAIRIVIENSEERIAIGGLMRCCTGTWGKAMQAQPDGHTDGDVLPCKHCSSQMIRDEGVWREDRPCGFGYHRPDCKEADETSHSEL